MLFHITHFSVCFKTFESVIFFLFSNIQLTSLNVVPLVLQASLVAQTVKQETWVQSLGWEYPLEEEMATHSSILAWRIPWTEEPVKLQSIRVSKSQT